MHAALGHHGGLGGYQGFGGGLSDGDTATHLQGQSNITSIKGRHTLHGGVDVRRAQRDRTGGGNRSGQLAFDRTYTRQYSDESTLTPSNLGLALAAFELGLPTSASINDTVASSFSNYWMGTFAQDTWRLGRFTLNAGLRFEYETGAQEKDGQMIVGFDPTARLAITDAAQAAYLASGLQNQPGMPATLSVLGGPTYANDAGHRCRLQRAGDVDAARVGVLPDRRPHRAQGRLRPLLRHAERVRLPRGAGGLQRHDDVDDLRRSGPHLQVGDAGDRRGSFDPFPVRADGTRWDPVVGDALGVNTLLGGALTTENGLREHARQQRWRVSLQRQLSSNLGVEVAYAGAYNDKLPVTIRGDYLPEQYWDGSNTRNTAANTFLTAQVPNPYFINNFAFLRTTDPVLYQRLASNPTFSSATIQRNRLLRPFGNMTGPWRPPSNLALGASKSHSLELQVNRRFANGLSGFLSFFANSVRYNRTVEEFDREPTLWQGSNDARPWRLAGVASYELPFGRGRQFLTDGGMLAAFASNWQVAGTWEFQPGALLDWGNQNIFFYGDLDDIPLDDPTREEWFNIEAGFERDPAKTTGRVPEARLPVPRRRSARDAADVRQPVDPAQLRRRRRPYVAVPNGRAESVESPAVGRSDPESDQHTVRSGHGRGAEPDALLHLRRPRDVLTPGHVVMGSLGASRLRATTSFDLFREPLAFGTDFIDEFGIRGELLPQGHRPRLRVGLWIVDRDLDVEMSEVGSPDSLTNLCAFGNHAAVPIDPRVIAKSDGVDHQRVVGPGGRRIAFPRTDWAPPVMDVHQ